MAGVGVIVFLKLILEILKLRFLSPALERVAYYNSVLPEELFPAVSPNSTWGLKVYSHPRGRPSDCRIMGAGLEREFN